MPWHGAEWCPQECEADSQCPRGQRCTHSGCGHVCTDPPRGELGLGQAGPNSTLGAPQQGSPHGLLCIMGREECP